MSDQEVQVKFSGNVGDLLSGMKSAQESVATATEGIKGDMGALSEAFESMGPAALAIGGVGLAFEGLKEAIEDVQRSFEQFKELSESMEALHLRTGASYEQLTVMNNAMTLAGGTTEQFQSVLRSLGMRMATNAELFVANGVAASKADLEHQDLMTTLEKSIQVIEGIEDPGRRAEVAVALLGGRAGQALPMLLRMNEVLQKNGQTLADLGANIDTDSIAKMDQMIEAEGRLKAEQQGLDQQLSESGFTLHHLAEEIDLVWSRYEVIASGGTGLTEKETAANQGLAKSLKVVEESMKALSSPGMALHDLLQRLKGAASGWGGESSGGGTSQSWGEESAGKGSGEKGNRGETQQELQAQLEAAKKAAAEHLQIVKQNLDEEAREAVNTTQRMIQADKDLVAAKKMDFDAMRKDVQALYDKEYETVWKTLEKERQAMAGKPVEQNAILIKEKELEQHYLQQTAALKQEAAKHDEELRKEAEKEQAASLKRMLEVKKLQVAEEESETKNHFAVIKAQLDQEVAMGQLGGKQELAAKKQMLDDEWRMESEMFARKLLAESNDEVAFQKLLNERLTAERKYEAQVQALRDQADQQRKQKFDNAWNTLSSGFQSSITGMVQGTETLGQAWNKMLGSMEMAALNTFIQIGMDEAKQFVESQVLSHTTAATKVADNAAVAGTAAAASAAQDGPWGWATAIPIGLGVAAAALAMFSAEGGWDRVPADAVTQLHKNEMVLPANLAEGARNTFAAAARGGGGGGTTINAHFHGAVDAEGFFRQNQSAIMKTINEAVRNGRMR